MAALMEKLIVARTEAALLASSDVRLTPAPTQPVSSVRMASASHQSASVLTSSTKLTTTTAPPSLRTTAQQLH